MHLQDELQPSGVKARGKLKCPDFEATSPNHES
jgi:hypothetical protein